jgi:hypothetical protein
VHSAFRLISRLVWHRTFTPVVKVADLGACRKTSIVIIVDSWGSDRDQLDRPYPPSAYGLKN